jgi:bifunctional non-homologous end joining protein LigD
MRDSAKFSVPASKARGSAKPPGSSDARRAAPGSVLLTHPQRELWPGVTKQDLADYWRAVAALALPGIAGRPLAILRCPAGVGGAQFFQKHGHKGLPRQIRAGAAEGEPYLAVDDADGLVAMAQISAIELHAWGASEHDPARPDRIVLDLDPGDGVAYAEVVDAALLLRERLAALKLVSFCRTTGGHGLHVVTPLSRPTTWAQARAFSKGMAEALSSEAPQRFVTTVSKEARRGRILIDWLRNGLGATAVASYSPRAREGATVAAPLAWTEVTPALNPHAFTVRTMPARLAGRGAEAWAGYDETTQGLPDGSTAR